MEIFLRVLLLAILLVLGYLAQSSTVMYAAGTLITILLVDTVLRNFKINDYLSLLINVVFIVLVILLIAYLLKLATTSNFSIFGAKFTKGHGFLKFEGDILVFLKKNAVTIGVLFLMLYSLIPIAQGEIAFKNIAEALVTWKAWVCIAVGILITLLAKNGVPLMGERPDILAFLVMGIIIGVVVFDGYPTGPLIGSGLAYFAFLAIESLIKVFEK